MCVVKTDFFFFLDRIYLLKCIVYLCAFPGFLGGLSSLIQIIQVVVLALFSKVRDL